MKNNKSYFGLRFVSTVIDLSIIYSLSIIFQFLIWKYTFVRLCDIFVFIFCIYYLSSYILLKGISPAKLLIGLKIANSNGADIHLNNILFREILLKLFIGIITPSYLLQFLFPIWSPLITLSIELLFYFYLLFCFLFLGKAGGTYFQKQLSLNCLLFKGQKRIILSFFLLL